MLRGFGFTESLSARIVSVAIYMQESYVVRKMKILRAASPNFFQIVLAIEVFCDLESMTVEDLVGRLKA